MLKLPIDSSGGIDEIIDGPLLVNLPRLMLHQCGKCITVIAYVACGMEMQLADGWSLGPRGLGPGRVQAMAPWTLPLLEAWSFGIIKPELSTGHVFVCLFVLSTVRGFWGFVCLMLYKSVTCK